MQRGPLQSLECGEVWCPDAPDRFLLAIKCDGATYHRAKTARDRDRLRQTQPEFPLTPPVSAGPPC